jgi:hypothetical protein
MELTGQHTLPQFPGPHPNLSDQVNHNIVQSEVEGGVYLSDLPFGTALVVETENRQYRLIHHGSGRALISGHPDYCPDPVLVTIDGSNWGGSMLKMSFIGRGMRLEFRHPQFRTIMTSRIVNIRQDI